MGASPLPRLHLGRLAQEAVIRPSTCKGPLCSHVKDEGAASSPTSIYKKTPSPVHFACGSNEQALTGMRAFEGRNGKRTLRVDPGLVQEEGFLTLSSADPRKPKRHFPR